MKFIHDVDAFRCVFSSPPIIMQHTFCVRVVANAILVVLYAMRLVVETCIMLFLSDKCEALLLHKRFSYFVDVFGSLNGCLVRLYGTL